MPRIGSALLASSLGSDSKAPVAYVDNQKNTGLGFKGFLILQEITLEEKKQTNKAILAKGGLEFHLLHSTLRTQ